MLHVALALSVILGSLCYGIVQVLHSGYNRTVFCKWNLDANFWDPMKSWKSKGRIRALLRLMQLRVKFFLSKWLFGMLVEGITTCIVWITDAWHLFCLLLVLFLSLSAWLCCILYPPLWALGCEVVLFLTLFELLWWRTLRLKQPILSYK